MENNVTKETVKTLAEANGLTLPDHRLERVLKQYQSFLQQLARLDAYELPMDAEPSILFTLLSDAPGNPEPPHSGTAKGEGHGT